MADRAGGGGYPPHRHRRGGGEDDLPRPLGRRHLLRHAALAGVLIPLGARAEGAPGFIRIIPTEGREVWLAPAQVVRIARVDGATVIDTAAWVQQRTTEGVDAVAARLQAAGLRLLGLTDLNQNRVWLAAGRVVAVRDSNARHAPGAHAAIIMVGLRYNTDVAVRESVEEVMTLLRGGTAL